MKDYKNDSPVFSDSISITETTDAAHADNINAAPKQLLANTLHLKKGIEYIDNEISSHINEIVTDENGVHGLRYHNEELQVNINNEWIQAGGDRGGLLTPNVTNFSINRDNDKRPIVSFKIPNDVEINGYKLFEKEKIRIFCRKLNQGETIENINESEFRKIENTQSVDITDFTDDNVSIKLDKITVTGDYAIVVLVKSKNGIWSIPDNSCKMVYEVDFDKTYITHIYVTVCSNITTELQIRDYTYNNILQRYQITKNIYKQIKIQKDADIRLKVINDYTKGTGHVTKDISISYIDDNGKNKTISGDIVQCEVINFSTNDLLKNKTSYVINIDGCDLSHNIGTYPAWLLARLTNAKVIKNFIQFGDVITRPDGTKYMCVSEYLRDEVGNYYSNIEFKVLKYDFSKLRFNKVKSSPDDDSHSSVYLEYVSTSEHPTGIEMYRLQKAELKKFWHNDPEYDKDNYGIKTFYTGFRGDGNLFLYFSGNYDSRSGAVPQVVPMDMSNNKLPTTTCIEYNYNNNDFNKAYIMDIDGKVSEKRFTYYDKNSWLSTSNLGYSYLYPVLSFALSLYVNDNDSSKAKYDKFAKYIK